MTLDKDSRLSTDHLNANWLLVCAAMVFLMATIGAVTRLTESGLSIAQWKPVTGALPPLNAAQWQAEFDVYKATPQYQQVNKGMELGDFKKIYFWEWLHRLWGRLIGLIFALPLAFFWATRRVADDYKWKYVGLLGLGGLQGVVGWWMVESGLIHNPAVSHYRLATHLALALTLGALMRRNGSKVAARDHLRVAVELLDRCGASPAAAFAREELAATGVRLPRTALLLTPSERRVAELALAGLSNPEIGARLHVTRKTVETHLSAAYRKLGISGREDLRAEHLVLGR